MNDIISGVYCIENLINHKQYVGQSVDIYRRFYEHRYSLNHNKHYNSDLQNDWNVYNSENFIFYILEKCDITLLESREKYWIDKFDTLKIGYNLVYGIDNPMNYKKCRENLSIGLKGNKNWLGKKHTEQSKKENFFRE